MRRDTTGTPDECPRAGVPFSLFTASWSLLGFVPRSGIVAVPARPRIVATLACLGALVGFGAPAGAHGAASTASANDPRLVLVAPLPQAADPGARAPVAATPAFRRLARLRGAEYASALDAVAADAPGDALHAVVLRAGRPAPPTVTASRRAEREAHQADALAWLRERLEGLERETWVAHLRALLRRPSAGSLGNARNGEELWCATARAIGSLGLDELADEVALSLDDDRAARGVAARAALFDLHLVWYPDHRSFLERRAAGAAMCDDPRFYAELRAQVELSRSRLGEILRLDPERAFVALSDDDPLVRADAARALGRGVADGRVERDKTFERLIDAAREECEAGAFHAALDTLVAMQAGAPADAVEVGRLRVLVSERILDGVPGLQASISQACSRLPVAFNVESKGARVDRMLFLLDDQLTALVAQDGLVDDDAMLACLRAALGLCDRARSAGLVFDDEMNKLRGHLYEVLEWGESFREVRLAAAQVLARLTRPKDLGEFAARMEAQRGDSELVYGMIGPLADAAAAAEPGDEGAQRALALLVSWCSHVDVDLRGRAIASVADPRLAELAHGIGAAGFVDQLARENEPDLQRALLGLIERHGGAADARRVLELPNFDALVVGNPAVVGSLVRTLGVLAGGDHELTFTSAERLLSVDEPATRVRRLGDAIRLTAGLSDEEAQMLAREQHAAIVQWAMELRASGGGLVAWDEPSICAAFLQRLTALHVPRSLQPGAEPTGVDEHRLALLLSDLNTVLPGAVSQDEILGHFELALADAAERPDAGQERAVVLRDRARFHLDSESPTLARADYRTLLEMEGGAEAARLDLRDLRAAGELIERVPADPTRPTRAESDAAREAFSVSRRLVARPAWTSETAGLRMADLVDLAERARWSRDPAVLDEALTLFRGLPDALADGTPPPTPPAGARWGGLATDATRLSRLVAERDALTATPRPVVVPVPGGGADGGGATADAGAGGAEGAGGSGGDAGGDGGSGDGGSGDSAGGDDPAENAGNGDGDGPAPTDGDDEASGGGSGSEDGAGADPSGTAGGTPNSDSTLDGGTAKRSAGDSSGPRAHLPAARLDLASRGPRMSPTTRRGVEQSGSSSGS